MHIYKFETMYKFYKHDYKYLIKKVFKKMIKNVDIFHQKK